MALSKHQVPFLHSIHVSFAREGEQEPIASSLDLNRSSHNATKWVKSHNLCDVEPADKVKPWRPKAFGWTPEISEIWSTSSSCLLRDSLEAKLVVIAATKAAMDQGRITIENHKKP